MSDQKQPKPPLPDIGKRGLKGFFEDVSAEMRKVIWPSRDDVVRLTSMVLMVCVAFVVYLFLFERIVGFAVAALTGEKT